MYHKKTRQIAEFLSSFSSVLIIVILNQVQYDV